MTAIEQSICCLAVNADPVPNNEDTIPVEQRSDYWMS